MATNAIKIKRKIAAGKSAPAGGTAGELALWKAGTATTDALAIYAHDGVQYVPIVDTDANVTLPKPGAGTAGRQVTADAAGAVSWTPPAASVAPTLTISGTLSITGGGDLSANRTMSLVNDSAAPGNGFYYGTNSTGVKGFYALPAGAGATGDVVGPASAVDNGIARFDATTGKLIQGSTGIIDDTGNLTGINNAVMLGSVFFGATAANTVTIIGDTLTIPNGLNIDSNTLMIDATNNRVGFGTATPASQADVNGVASHNVIASTGVMDLANGQMFTAQSSAAIGWSFQNVPASRGVTVVLHLTNGGAFTQTWPTSVKWPGGTAPTLTAAGTDVLVFVTHDGGATWRGNIFGKDIK